MILELMAKNKLKNWIYGGGVLILLVILFGWPIVNDKTRPLVKAWNAAGVGCISGHSAIQGVGQHIHQTLNITVDGKPEKIVGDLGISRGCMAELHVHAGTDNYIHLESLDKQKKFTLGQFLAVYGKELNREGYTLEATLNGQPYTGDISQLILEDKQVIELKYKPS